MARTPILERSLSIKVLGTAFLAMCVFFLWLTFAFFNKAFVDQVPITLVTDTAGVNLPQNADVKLRGMTVGEVREVEPDGEQVKLTLAMKPELLGDVPKGVTAQLIPKTLFGEKYVALIPPEIPTEESLQAGDTITKASVPIETEQVLNDLYPLLQAVEPADLSYTLSALSTALDGRGEQLGDTLVTLNSYLKKTEPDVPILVDDVIKLGTVSDGYADALPDLGRLLENVTTTGNTIVEKEDSLASFLTEGTRLSDTLTTFTEDNGDNLVTLARESRPVLETVGKYSPTFPCFLGALQTIIPRLDSAFRDNMLHIDVELIQQPTAYEADENFQTPSREVINATPEAQPTCLDLEDINNGIEKFGQDTEAGPYPGPDPSVYGLIGLKGSHGGKFGDDADFNRAAVENLPMVQSSLPGSDTPQQRSAINELLGAGLGVPSSSVSDLGALLVSPVIRGSEVSISDRN